MKIYLDCYPCFLRQAIEAANFVTEDEKIIKQIVDAVASRLPKIPAGCTPPQIGGDIHRIIREISGINDPYRRVKDENIAEAKSYFDEMKAQVAKSDSPLRAAARIAIIGNIIDYGTCREFDISSEIFSLLDEPLAIDSLDEMRSALRDAKSVLYLGDNAGESVFDRILIEEIKVPVTYAVRGIPVLNDVTMDDAIASGLAEVSEIISSGTTAPGTLLDECSDEFLELFEKTDVIISKGQGNYEALSGIDRPIFFLLRAKCSVIAKDLGVEEGGLILKGMNIRKDRIGDE